MLTCRNSLNQLSCYLGFLDSHAQVLHDNARDRPLLHRHGGRPGGVSQRQEEPSGRDQQRGGDHAATPFTKRKLSSFSQVIF